MKLVAYENMLTIFSIIALGAPLVSSNLYSQGTESQKHLWKKFKNDYHRQYKDLEDEYRFANFVQNLKRMNELQSMTAHTTDGVHTVGMNRFSDMNETEFRSIYLTLKLPTQEELETVPIYDMGTCSTTKTSVNWAGQQTTPIKDQGSCGSCWATVAAEQVESDIMRTFGQSYEYLLSEEQFLDCARPPNWPNNGCDGGNQFYAFSYLQTHYTEKDVDYPYTSGNGDPSQKTCKYNANLGVAGLTSFTSLPKDETCMAQYVQQTGTLSATVFATNWHVYNPSVNGGIMTAAQCGTGTINHAVQIVGVNIPGGYWIIRNTWGVGWGKQGYIWLEYGKNACGIQDQFPTMMTTPFLYSSPSSPTRAPISSARPSTSSTRSPTTRVPSGPTRAPTRKPTVAPTNSTAGSSSTSSGTSLSSIGGVAGLAGVIIAVIVGAAIVGWLVWYCHRKRSQQASPSVTETDATDNASRKNPMV